MNDKSLYMALLICWIALVALFMMTTPVNAQTSSLNLQLPSAPQNYQSDKFRSGDMDCSNAIGGATNLEFGVTGIVDNAVSPFSSEDPNNPTTKDIGVYARIIMPLDAPRERINCNTLYQLELQKKRLEVMRLEEELKRLRELQFQN